LGKEKFAYMSFNKTKIYTFNVNYFNTVMNSHKVKEKIVSAFAFLHFIVISIIATDFK